MNTLLLKYAVEVEKAGSITEAADNLYMGQPNLSKAIKELEDTLGINIFKRTSKGIIPTVKGEKFLKYAKNILYQVDAMEKLKINDDPDLQMFSVSIPRCSYIAGAVKSFISLLNQDKAIDANIEETNSMQTIYNVVSGKFNFGIIQYQSDYEKYFLDFLENKKIIHSTIWEYEKLAVMPKNHPLAVCSKLKYSDLDKYTKIVYGDMSIPYLNTEDNQDAGIASGTEKAIYVYERMNWFDLLSHISTAYSFSPPIPEEYIEQYKLVQRRCKF